MKLTFRLIAMLALIVTLASSLYAGTEIKTSGQIRMRGEYGDKSDQLTLLRTRIMFDAGIKDNAHAVIQLQDSRVIGNYTVEDKPASGGLNYGYAVDVHQAYLQVDQLWNKGIGVKAGRFEVNLGNQRVFGAVGWHNVGRSWEGLEIWYNLSNLNISEVNLTGFWLKKLDRTHVGGVIDSADFDIVGLQADIKPWNLQLFGFFELDALRKDTTPDWSSLPITFSTTKYAMQRTNIGLYYQRNYGQFDFEMNSVYQFGKKLGWDSVATNTLEAIDIDIAAYMFTFEAGYTFDMSIKPRLAAGIDYASGDDNTGDDKIETYNNLYYTGHKFRGYMDYFLGSGDAGLINMMLRGKVNPAKGWTVKGDFHYFTTAANYTYNNTDTKDVGMEIDLGISTTRVSGVKVAVGGSVFMPTEAYAGMANPGTTFWGYTMITANF